MVTFNSNQCQTDTVDDLSTCSAMYHSGYHTHDGQVVKIRILVHGYANRLKKQRPHLFYNSSSLMDK